jgi:hypothetical protein
MYVLRGSVQTGRLMFSLQVIHRHCIKIEATFVPYFLYLMTLSTTQWSRDNSVSIATGYGLDDQGGGGSSSPGRVKIFTSPYRPDRLWGPPNLL